MAGRAVASPLAENGLPRLFLPRGHDRITVDENDTIVGADTFGLQHDVNSVQLTVRPTFDFNTDKEPQQINGFLGGLPAGVPDQLTITLTPLTAGGSHCLREYTGIRKRGGEPPVPDLLLNLQPDPYNKFCSGRYKLKVTTSPSPGDEDVVASTKLTIS